MYKIKSGQSELCS